MVHFGAGEHWSEILGNQLAKTALDAHRHTFARFIQHSASYNHKGHFRFISAPTKMMMLWHHSDLETFGRKCWVTKWPEQHWMHPGTPLQDASNTEKVKITKVILGSFITHQDDGVVAPFKSGGIWSEMLGDQMAQTALDAPRHTFARCIQHSERTNHKGHFRFIQHPPR